jgi:parallel beta-helix repeat protein
MSKKSRKLVLTPGMNIDNILIDNLQINTFFFPDGDYFMSKDLKINRSKISFIGLSKKAEKVHIYQNSKDHDGFDVEKLTRFRMKYISLHVETPGKVALVMANVNNSSVSNCYFYGNTTTFTIFYAGPDMNAGEDTINGYKQGNLDSNNRFYRNVIHAPWSGDTVSFSLQKNGFFSRNIIRGGKLAVYMCKDTIIKKNIMVDSTTNGIFVSLPSHNLTITENKILESTHSGIVIKNQLEHGSFDISDYHIEILNNFIYDPKFHFIEINNSRSINVKDNFCVRTNNFGIYLFNSSNIVIDNNSIHHFKNAIYLEQSNNNFITNNTFMNHYPTVASHACKLSNSNNNTIQYNNIKGRLLYELISQYQSPENIISDNNYEKFTNYGDDHLFFIIK